MANMYVYVNESGLKIKTNSMTMKQNSTDSVLHLITIGHFASVTCTFRLSDSVLSDAYHMVDVGKYELTVDDMQYKALVDNADNLYEYEFTVPLRISSETVIGNQTRMNVAFASYSYDNRTNFLKCTMTANTQITLQAADHSATLDESYSATDIENLWRAAGRLEEEKQDVLPTIVNDRYLHTNAQTGALEWSEVQGGGGDYSAGTGININNRVISADQSVMASKTYVDNHHDSSKQDTLTAGQNITIQNNVISATGGGQAYSAGNGIQINSNVISVKPSEISYNDLANKPSIPTKTSDLNNDSGFITNAYHDSSKQDVLTAGAGITISGSTISASVGVTLQVVDTLPTTGQPNIIYLVPSSSATSQNVKDEYIWVNNAWEKIGSTSIDLSNYYTKSETNTQIQSAVAGKQNTLTAGSNISIVGNTISATDTTYSSNNGIVKNGNTFGLRQDFYDYLLAHAVVAPEAFLSLPISTTYEYGTNVTVSSIIHYETRVDSIVGYMTLKKDGVDYQANIEPFASSTTVNLTNPIVLNGTTGCSLTIAGNYSGGTFTSGAQSISFVDYAYGYSSADTNFKTSWDSSVMQYEANYSDGVTVSVTGGQYASVYSTKANGDFQWYDSDLTHSWSSFEEGEFSKATITFTQKNGYQRTYYVYYTQYLESGTVKFRVI